jgi:hypothetical protein
MTEDHHQRNAVGERVDDCGESVTAAGPFGDHGDTDFAGAAGITIGDIYGGLLVASENQRHLTVLMQRIKDRQNIIAGQGGNELHAFDLQNIDDRIGNSCHRLPTLWKIS